MKFLGPINMVTLLVNTHLIVRPINKSIFVNVKSKVFSVLFRDIRMNIDARYRDYLSFSLFNKFFDVFDQRFLWHFISMYTKDIITGRLFNMKLSIFVKDIKGSLK